MIIVEDDDEEIIQPEELVEPEAKMEVDVEEPKFLKSTSIQLGDIISFITQDPDDNMNNLIFYVTYINSTRIQLKQIESSTNYSIELEIRENHHVFYGEKKIPTWRLLYRNKYPGFAKQNNLTKGTWLDIQFDVSTPNILITAEIIDVVEDMIVLKLYNGDNKRFYINFNYSGLPPDLHIVSIKLREKPRALSTTEQKQPSPTEMELVQGEDEESPQGEEKESPTIADQVRDAEKRFERIIIMRDVENKFRPERLLNQVDDLLKSIIITETEKLNNQNLTVDNIFIANKAQKMVERFIQLREQFTKFNNDKVVIGPLIKSEKPLLSYFLNFSTSLYWIMPGVTNIKKVYDNVLAEEGEVDENMVYLEQDQYREDLNNASKNSTNLEDYDKQISDILTPFEETENKEDYLIEFATKTDITTLVSNIESNPLTTNSFSKIDSKSYGINEVRFSQLRYNLGLTGLKKLDDDFEEKEKKNYLNRDLFHTEADKMQLVSFVTLPESVIQFSRVNLPYSSILMKSNYSLQPFACWKLLNMKTENVNNIQLDSSQDEDLDTELLQVNSPNNNAENKVEQSQITSYTLEKTNGSLRRSESESIYIKCINQIVPSMKQTFQKMLPFMDKNVKMSLIDTISYLEPFLIYSDDVTFPLYTRIKEFLRNEIDQYTKSYYKKQIIFSKIRLPIPKMHITDLSLIELISVTKGDRQEVLSSYDLLPNLDASVISSSSSSNLASTLLNSDIYNQIIQVDCARLFCSSIALHNSVLMNVNLDKGVTLSLGNESQGEQEEQGDQRQEGRFKLREEIIETNFKNIQALNKEMELRIQDEYNYNLRIISKLTSIEHFNYLKDNNQKVTMSMSTKVNEPIDSPSKKILNLILQQKSDILRNFNIKRFKEQFLREPLLQINEQKNWLYAKTKSESQPLLPRFVYEMALAFITSRQTYPQFLDNLLVDLNAKFSGDNKSLVDPATGWKIVDRAFVEENLTYLVDEPDEQELEIEKEKTLNIMYEVNKKQHDPYQEALYRETNNNINKVIKALFNQFFITFIPYEQISFIINEVNGYLDHYLLTKENYLEKSKKAERKTSYDDYKEEQLFYATVTLFFIALQTSVPSPIRKNSVPTCTFSFAGYPLEEGNNYEGIDYIACGVQKMHMADGGIWRFITKNQDKFRRKMVDITKQLLSSSYNVITKIDLKRKQIIMSGLDIEKSNKDKEPLRHWDNFLPPLAEIHNITNPENISSVFKDQLIDDMKNSNNRQLEEISVAESKMFHFSLSIQKVVQDIVHKETKETTGLLLKSLAEKVYTANACCQSEASYSVLDYFNSQSNNEITSKNNQVNTITTFLKDIAFLSQATTFLSALNTKIVFPPTSTEFSESTAFKAFIHYYQLRSPASTVFLDDDIKQLIDLELPYEQEGEKKSLNQLYTKLKEDGKFNDMITGEKLKILLKIVSSKNMIKQSATQFSDCEENISLILEESPSVSQEPDIEKLLAAYLKKSTLETYEPLFNFLDSSNKQILEALGSDLQGFKSFQEIFSSNEIILNDSAIYQRINFIKNFIMNIVNVYPSMIVNGVKRGFEPSPSMKKESAVQKIFIEKLLQKSNDNILKNFTLSRTVDKKVCEDIFKSVRESPTCQLMVKLSQNFPINLKEPKNKDDLVDNRILIIMLFNYFVLQILSQYVKTIKRVIRNPNNTQTFFKNLIKEYINEFTSYGQKEMTYSYEKINEETFIAAQDEKHLFLHNIQKMNEEQLEIYKMYRKIKKNKEVRFFDPKTFMEDLDRNFAIDEMKRQKTIDESNVIMNPEQNPVISFDNEDGADYGNDGNDQNMDMDMND